MQCNVHLFTDSLPVVLENEFKSFEIELWGHKQSIQGQEKSQTSYLTCATAVAGLVKKLVV